MLTNSWNNYLELLSPQNKDIYFTEEYCNLYNDNVRHSQAFVYNVGSSVFVLPFMIGEVPGTSGIFDFESPYGYGGPLCNNIGPSFLDDAIQTFKHECVGAGIVAGFLRFHPFLENSKLLESQFSVFNDRKTIALDLRPTIEEIWDKQVHSKNRNMIRKAINSDLRYEADISFKHVEKFILLYNSTMDKLSADFFYYFNDNYFEKVIKYLDGHAFLSNVWNGDKLISSAVIMYQNGYGHYHLAGSDKDCLKYSPNNMLLWETALELKKIGVRTFHLGGGSTSDPNDSLFCFKKKFSTNEYQFSIGKLIFMHEEYQKLCSEWRKKNPEKVTKYGNLTLCYRK